MTGDCWAVRAMLMLPVPHHTKPKLAMLICLRHKVKCDWVAV